MGPWPPCEDLPDAGTPGGGIVGFISTEFDPASFASAQNCYPGNSEGGALNSVDADPCAPIKTPAVISGETRLDPDDVVRRVKCACRYKLEADGTTVITGEPDAQTQSTPLTRADEGGIAPLTDPKNCIGFDSVIKLLGSIGSTHEVVGNLTSLEVSLLQKAAACSEEDFETVSDEFKTSLDVLTSMATGTNGKLDLAMTLLDQYPTPICQLLFCVSITFLMTGSEQAPDPPAHFTLKNSGGKVLIDDVYTGQFSDFIDGDPSGDIDLTQLPAGTYYLVHKPGDGWVDNGGTPPGTHEIIITEADGKGLVTVDGNPLYDIEHLDLDEDEAAEHIAKLKQANSQRFLETRKFTQPSQDDVDAVYNKYDDLVDWE
jgi:hypothetical protein